MTREHGYYYVSVGFDWEIWKWDGRHWWEPGDERPTGDSVHVYGRVPDPVTDQGFDIETEEMIGT